MKLQGAYLTKKVTSSNEDAVTATATSSAAAGSHTLEVSKLASSQYVTSGEVKEGTKSSTKLSDLGMAVGTVISVKVGTGEDVEEKKLTIKSSTTVKDFVKHLQDAGLNASFDEKQGRFFISSKESGKDNAFTITASGTKQGSSKEILENAIGENSDTLVDFYAAVEAGENTTELKDKLIEEAKVNKKAEILAGRADEYVEKLKTDSTIEAAKTINEKYFGKDVIPVFDSGDNLTTEFDATLVAGIKTELGADATDEEVKAEALKRYQTALKEAAAEYVSANETTVLTSDDNASIEAAGTTADAAVEAYIVDVQKGNIDLSENNELNKLGLTNIKEGMLSDTVDINGTPNDKTDDMSFMAAADAVFILDGATLTETSNNFTVAGITLDLKNETNGKVSLNVTNDADAVYDSFKEFIKEYNTILKEMNDLYGADSARGYEPLTDEEKEAMSEEQVELWEKKIKDSLLRRDSTLSSLTSAMRTAMQSTVEVDGKTYSLSSFGIMTSSDYTEKGLLHIYGDEDDEDFASETDKLKAALMEDPDTVAKVLSGIVTKLSDVMADKMKGTEVSSALTFYNDKEMKNQIKDYEDEIDKWEDRLLEMEDRYYKQFSAMETALAKLNSQSNYFASMMGMGQ